MASVLNHFFDQLKAAWEPPTLLAFDDGSTKNYHAIDTLSDELGLGQHREFYFEQFEEGLPTQTGGNIFHYDQPVYVFFDRRHRAHELFVRAVNDETRDLSLSFWNQYFPGGGVSGAELLRITNELPGGKAGSRQPRRAGGVPRDQIVSKCFYFRVRCDET